MAHSKKLPPGVTVMNDGARQGFFLRVTGMCPVKHKIIQRTVTLWSVTQEQALAERERIYQEIIAGGPTAKDRLPTLRAYATSWLERNAPYIRSGNTLSRYQDELLLHINPRFGDYQIDKIRKPDIEQWLADSARSKYPGKAGQKKKYAAASINSWYRTFKQILQNAAADYELPDPTMKVRPLPEDPIVGNTLGTKERLAAFLAKAKELTPQWYAMMYLGFAIGARKGELRPILKHKDLDFESGHLILSKSQRRGYIGPTKSRKVRDIFLPKRVVAVLRWHVGFLKQIGHPACDGPLLFPSYEGWRPNRKAKDWKLLDPETGRLRPSYGEGRVSGNHGLTRWSPEFKAIYARERRRWERAQNQKSRAAKGLVRKVPAAEELHYLSPSCLDKPMKIVCEALGWNEHFSSKAMRRTFNDLARAVGVNNLVIRSLTGWEDEGMQNGYTSVQEEERRHAIELVMDLVGGDDLVPKLADIATVNN